MRFTITLIKKLKIHCITAAHENKGASCAFAKKGILV